MNKIDKIKKKALILGIKVKELEDANSIIIYENDNTFSLYNDSINPELNCKYIVYKVNEITCVKDINNLGSNNLLELKQVIYKVENGKLIKIDKIYPSIVEMVEDKIEIYGINLRNTAKMMNFGMAYGMGNSKLADLLGIKGGINDVKIK